MRAFRVVAVLHPRDFRNCFSVTGKLKRPHKGHIMRSLKQAQICAREWAIAGWYTRIVRRTPTGWAEVKE